MDRPQGRRLFHIELAERLAMRGTHEGYGDIYDVLVHFGWAPPTEAKGMQTTMSADSEESSPKVRNLVSLGSRPCWSDVTIRVNHEDCTK